MSTFQSVENDESSVDENEMENIRPPRTSADLDDFYLGVVPGFSIMAWTLSYNYSNDNLYDHNTPGMWVYFYFGLIILLLTFIRLFWKLCIRTGKYKYDARTHIRKVPFVMRCFLTLSISVILLIGNTFAMGMGTQKMVKLCTILTGLDFLMWIVDCFLHWILNGFPAVFRAPVCRPFMCGVVLDPNDRSRIHILRKQMKKTRE